MIIILRKGWQKIMSTMNAIHKKQQNNCAHRAGPHSSDPSTKGFLIILETEQLITRIKYEILIMIIF